MSIEQEAINTGLKTMESAAEFIERITKELIKLVQMRADTRLERNLSKYLEDGGIPGYMRADKYVEELHKRLEEQDIPHMVSKLKDGYGAYVIFKAEDIERVEQIRNEILLEKGELSETTVQDLKRTNYGKKLGVITDLDDAQLNALREKTGWLNGQHNKYGWEITTIAFEKQENGLNRVYYRAEDAAKINVALSKMTWELTGQYGEKIRKQEEYDVKQRQDIMTAMRAGLKDVYIVSAQDPTDFIKLTKDGYIARHGEYEESKEKSNPMFERDLLEHLERMQTPIVLNSVEFAKNSDERDHIIAKYNKRPSITKKERELYEKERAIRELIEQKMLQYNGEQLENISSLYNNDVTIQEYLAHEVVNQVHEEEEISQIRTHFSEFIRQMEGYSTYEIVADEKDLDTILKEAEKESKKQPEQEEPDREV